MRILRISAFLTLFYFCMTVTAQEYEQLWKTDEYTGGMVIRNDEIFQVDIVNDSIYIHDITDGRKIGSFRTPGFEPQAVGIFRDTLIASDGDRIHLIDEKGDIYRTLYTSYVSSITGLSSEGDMIWLSCSSGKIYCISGEDGIIVKTIDGPGVSIIGLEYYGGYLWTMSRYRDELYIIEPKRDAVVNVLKTPGPYPSGLSVADNKIYLSDFEKDSIYILRTPLENNPVVNRPVESLVTLRWEITNAGRDTVEKTDVFFAVPVDMPNQEIMDEIRFNPQPDNYSQDRYGQKVAHYEMTDIEPGENYILKSEVKVKTSYVNYFIMPEKMGDRGDIPKHIKDTYISDDLRFQINSSYIQKSVENAIGDEKNIYWITRKILNYVAEEIDYERVGGWDIAPEVLKRGKGSCSEYAYAFIAMTRAAGIPARYVGAVAQRNDRASIDGVFHRWVEVYLPPYGWIPVDPGVADSPAGRNKAFAIGHLSNRYLITTAGGGDSRYMGWSYNFNERIKGYSMDKNVVVDRYAIWEPID